MIAEIVTLVGFVLVLWQLRHDDNRQRERLAQQYVEQHEQLRKEWGERVDGLLHLLENERRHSDDAMQVLLDRIQHPEVRQVLPSEPIPPLETDDAEMAHIGDIVPDFVNVGSHEQIRAEEPGAVTE